MPCSASNICYHPRLWKPLGMEDIGCVESLHCPPLVFLITFCRGILRVEGLLVLEWWRFGRATGSLHAKEQSYYEVLGVPENACKEDIKRAFRLLAKKYHPDANKNNPSAKKKVLEIRETDETPHDPEKRGQYDMVSSWSLASR
ncbi:unnamed protein product [Linum trigynum]|uniref:J domain-containing protein n=1 Tax=Linum trigynum TaxID=586398 RepID=A0AAV2FAS1_9ROSI